MNMLKPLGSVLIVSLFLGLFVSQEAIKVWQNFNEESISMEVEDTEENGSEDPVEDDELEDTDPEFLVSILDKKRSLIFMDIVTYSYINIGLSEKNGLDPIHPPESVV